MDKNSKLLALYNEVWFFFYRIGEKIKVKMGVYEDKEITDIRHSWFRYRNREYLSKHKTISDEELDDLINK
jgi:hypothetical protein